MRGVINHMAIEEGIDAQMSPIVNPARAFEDDTESDQDFSDNNLYK